MLKIKDDMSKKLKIIENEDNLISIEQNDQAQANVEKFNEAPDFEYDEELNELVADG